MPKIKYTKPNGTVIEISDTAANAEVAKTNGWLTDAQIEAAEIEAAEKAKAEAETKAEAEAKAKAEADAKAKAEEDAKTKAAPKKAAK